MGTNDTLFILDETILEMECRADEIRESIDYAQEEIDHLTSMIALLRKELGVMKRTLLRLNSERESILNEEVDKQP